MKPQITIRMGGDHDTVTVDGTVFDRSVMSQSQRNKLTRMLVDGWTKFHCKVKAS